MKENNSEKTMIGVLASHDNNDINNTLRELLEKLYNKKKKLLSNYHFVMTGGTYDRIILGKKKPDITPVNDQTKKYLLDECGITKLPSRKEGGVTILSFLITQQMCSIIWPFLTPLTNHWLNPENLALMRLSDYWHVKRLMNWGSVYEWFCREAELDIKRNLQKIPPKLEFLDTKSNSISFTFTENDKSPFLSKKEEIEFPEKIEEMTIALIAHNDMKARMIEFAIDNEKELFKFKRILSTGTTGREVSANTRNLYEKICRYHSGPKGGDIEIATEILFGRCHVVIFFIDPLNPHPHIEDIRVVFSACMIQKDVKMLTNEMQAREWIQRVVRG